MRTLIGGLVGAALATAAWLAIEYFTQSNLSWLVCLVGLITGASVRCASGAQAAESFLRGALAILLTLAAIVGGRQVFAKIMQASTVAPIAVAAAAEVPAAKGEAKVQGNHAEVAVELPDLSRATVDAYRGGKVSLTKNFSEWDMLWMSLAALGAYVVGKGGGKAAVAGATEVGAGVTEAVVSECDADSDES